MKTEQTSVGRVTTEGEKAVIWVKPYPKNHGLHEKILREVYTLVADCRIEQSDDVGLVLEGEGIPQTDKILGLYAQACASCQANPTTGGDCNAYYKPKNSF